MAVGPDVAAEAGAGVVTPDGWGANAAVVVGATPVDEGCAVPPLWLAAAASLLLLLRADIAMACGGALLADESQVAA